ncbi:hypothetical protein LVJ94_32915 [Pendulispora rubella]|uniref:Uncharacterized protein n=1 Tax=Pendulispora rubella TaxID=2741070 RepID=A0ABZ2KXG4_9BACT
MATLPRHEPLSVDALVDALHRDGLQPCDAWLEFQARYAGYEENLGNESAIWGIVHRDPFYLAANEVVAGQVRGRVVVMCADVHPSFEYSLYENGEFYVCGWFGRSETFDYKVERMAVVWEANEERAWVSGEAFAPRSPNAMRALLGQFGAEKVPEASDRFYTTWRATDIIAFESQDDRPGILVAADAREWIAEYARKINEEVS